MQRMTASQFPLVGQWMHSFEEDSGDLHAYRPANYPFPPARRGRAGIEFLPDGTFIERQIGPADAHQEVRGRWNYAGSGNVRVSFEDPNRPERTLEVVQCDDQRLCLRQHA